MQILKSKLIHKIIVLTSSLFLLAIIISIANNYVHFSSGPNQVGQVAGATSPTIGYKFCDDPGSANQTSCTGFIRYAVAAVTSPYQDVSGNVNISGNVGIGTAAPAHPLSVVGTGGASGKGIQFVTNDTALWGTNTSGTSYRMLVYGADNNVYSIANPGAWVFRTGGDSSGNNRMIIASNGNVGIGTQTPGYQLTLTGSAGKPGGGQWTDSSDVRLKKNVRPIQGALEKILKLQGVSFEWINPEEHGNLTGTQGGFIAQDIEKIFPGWISKIDPTGVDKTLVPSGDKIKSLALPFEYDAFLVEAIKEQQTQITNLQTENANLKLQLQALDLRLKALEAKAQ